MNGLRAGKREKQKAESREKTEGKTEDILDLLQDLGDVPEELRERILSIRDVEELQKLLRSRPAQTVSMHSKNYRNSNL